MGHRPSLLRRLTASAHSLDAAELETAVERHGCCRIDDTATGDLTTFSGRLRSVVFTPNEKVPTLRAELFDGTDTMELVWLGRRRIPGIEPGRRIIVRGRVGDYHGQHAIYNPWYELQPPG